MNINNISSSDEQDLMDNVLELNEQAVDFMLQRNDQAAYVKLIEALHGLQHVIVVGVQRERLLAIAPQQLPVARQQQPLPQQEEGEPRQGDGEEPPQPPAHDDDDIEEEEDVNFEDEYEEEFLLNRDEIDMNNDQERFLYYQLRIIRRRRGGRRRRRNRRGSHNNRRVRRRHSRDQQGPDINANNNDNNNDNINVRRDLLVAAAAVPRMDYIHFEAQVSEYGEICTVLQDQEICIRPFHMRARVTNIHHDVITDTLEMAGIILYNLGCVYIRSGLSINCSAMLYKSRHLFEQAFHNLQLTSVAFPTSAMSFDFSLLMASIAFNQCQLHTECFLDIHQANTQIALLQSIVESLEHLRIVNEQEDEIDLIRQHAQSLQFFRTRLAFVRLRNLHFAPLA